jgi:hypothetical protein
MHITSSLRRKRDEIVATIAAFEARIEAARRDLAALERAAWLFHLEDGGDEAAQHREFKSDGTREIISAAQVGVWESEPRPVTMLPLARTEASNDQVGRPFKSIGFHEPRGTGENLCSATAFAEERVPDEFFYFNWP